MACIDYKKAYDLVPQSWIINCLKMYKISHEVINFIVKTMKTWGVELTAEGRSLAETKTQRGIFQEDEMKKLWNMKVTIIPIVIGAFGRVTEGLLKGLEELEVSGRVETIQITTLLRRVLET